MLITKLTYQCCTTFPPDERFGLTLQMRRAAVSIPSNIAEGAGRGSVKGFSQFLSIATSSAYELETQFLLAAEFGYIDETRLQTAVSELVELHKMIYGFQKSLQPEN